MTVRGILAAIYCVLFTLGTWLIIQRNDLASTDFVVTQDLPLNHRLRENDVVLTTWNEVKSAMHVGGTGVKDFVGRYIRGAVPKGATLRLDETDGVPNVGGGRGHIELLATLSQSTAEKINAESCVRLQIKDPAPFRVITIVCPAAKQANCSAVLEVPITRLGNIDKTPVMVDAETPCQ